jgi:hypothetical protein
MLLLGRLGRLGPGKPVVWTLVIHLLSLENRT